MLRVRSAPRLKRTKSRPGPQAVFPARKMCIRDSPCRGARGADPGDCERRRGYARAFCRGCDRGRGRRRAGGQRLSLWNLQHSRSQRVYGLSRHPCEVGLLVLRAALRLVQVPHLAAQAVARVLKYASLLFRGNLRYLDNPRRPAKFKLGN